MGGSGGFYAGIKRAMEQEADWIWVSDDDAYLKDDALKQASDYLEEQPDLVKYQQSAEKLSKTGKWISIRYFIITKKGSVSVKHLFLQKCMRKKSLKWEALLM